MDFDFHQAYALDDYKNYKEPSVFFGMYRYEDYCLFMQHNSQDRVFWTGQDVIMFDWQNYFTGTNVTAHPKVKKHIEDKGLKCSLVKPAAFGLTMKPQVLGKKIYAYCPNSAPDYHGKKIIDELRCGGYEIIVGDGQFTQVQWKSGLNEMHYNQCFIGLCLSEFAGGGLSIIEMGLRGMKVVTNVFNLPNCIPWNSIHDIVQAIEDQRRLIGQTRESVARYTWDGLDHKHEWLEI